jgi:RHS repeat-associated protein
LKNRLTYCQYRLMEGLYTGTLAEGISTTMYNGTHGYDKNGNIGYLKRTTGGGATVMDQLIYSYAANQLKAVADGGDATKGFKDKVNTTDYTYDAAGNMTSDANKDLSIAYNHLNLPGSITRNTPVSSSGVENNGVVKHYYAGATKVRMETYDATGTTLVKAYDYLAGMVYQETVTAGTSTKELDFIASPEGRALLTKKVFNLTADPTTGDKFRFEYSLKDHLGNLRVSCRCGEPSRDQAGMIIPEGQPGAGTDLVAVVQEQHYDAWGLAFSFVIPSGVENLKNRFKYNCKEELEELEIGLYEYGFRWYDATLARFIQVDPLANEYPYKSVYDYAENDPITNVDLDGLEKLNYLKIASTKSVTNNARKTNESASNIFSGSVGVGLGVSEKIQVGNFKTEIGVKVLEVKVNLEKNNSNLQTNFLSGSAEAGGAGVSTSVLETKTNAKGKVGTVEVNSPVSSSPEGYMVAIAASYGFVSAEVKANLSAVKVTVDNAIATVGAFFNSFLDQSTNSNLSNKASNKKYEK